jgi:hypothetical protein
MCTTIRRPLGWRKGWSCERPVKVSTRAVTISRGACLDYCTAPFYEFTRPTKHSVAGSGLRGLQHLSIDRVLTFTIDVQSVRVRGTLGLSIRERNVLVTLTRSPNLAWLCT